MADINMALAYIAMNGDAKIIRHYLNSARSISQTLSFRHGSLYCKAAFAELQLLNGATNPARKSLVDCLVTAQSIMANEGIIFCLERLADFHPHMHSLGDTWAWAGLLFAYTIKHKVKAATIAAFRCLAIIFIALGDDETTFNLFQAALDGFAFMDIHRWRGGRHPPS
jgi:hypothetical protein